MKPIDKLTGIATTALLLLGFGSFVLIWAGYANISGQEPSMERSVFAVANSITLTGFEQPVSINEYRALGQTIILFLMLGGIFFTLIVGGCSLKRLLDLQYSDSRIMQAAVWIFLFFVMAGAAALIGPEVNLRAAIFQAISAFGNCGLVLGNAFQITDWKTHAILLPLAFVGGLGIPVLLDIGGVFGFPHRFMPHTKNVLVMSAILYLIGTISIFAIQADWQKLTGGSHEEAIEHAKSVAILSSGEALDARTLGMPFGAVSLLVPAAKWVVIFLMFVGGNPAGTAGGLKTTTLAVVVRDSMRAIRGKPVGRAFGLACGWLLIYLLATLVTAVIFSLMQPQVPGDQVLWLSVGALSNVGEFHQPLSMTGGGMYVLSAAMLFGRFVPLIFLWLAARADKPSSYAIQ